MDTSYRPQVLIASLNMDSTNECLAHMPQANAATAHNAGNPHLQGGRVEMRYAHVPYTPLRPRVLIASMVMDETEEGAVPVSHGIPSAGSLVQNDNAPYHHERFNPFNPDVYIASMDGDEGLECSIPRIRIHNPPQGYVTIGSPLPSVISVPHVLSPSEMRAATPPVDRTTPSVRVESSTQEPWPPGATALVTTEGGATVAAPSQSTSRAPTANPCPAQGAIRREEHPPQRFCSMFSDAKRVQQVADLGGLCGTYSDTGAHAGSMPVHVAPERHQQSQVARVPASPPRAQVPSSSLPQCNTRPSHAPPSDTGCYMGRVSLSNILTTSNTVRCMNPRCKIGSHPLMFGRIHLWSANSHLPMSSLF